MSEGVKVVELSGNLDRPTSLFDRPRLEAISEDDEGIFFHVPFSPSRNLSPVSSRIHLDLSSPLSSIPSCSSIASTTSIIKSSNLIDETTSETHNEMRRTLSKAQMRLKSLKSMKRHTKRKDSISLREEEKEKEEGEEEEEGEAMGEGEKKEENDEKSNWIDNRSARSGFISFVSFLYALIIIVYLIVEETTYEDMTDQDAMFPPGTTFHYYMYAVGIGFIIYVNLFIIHPPWFNRILYSLADKGWWKKAEKHIIMPAAHNSHPVSSFYLRLGTALFGCAGVVLFGLELFLLFSGKVSTRHISSSAAENILGALFIFLQMYFMNVNYKLSIDFSQNVCCFGFMHNFALNIWIWHRYSAAKKHEDIIKHEIRERDEREESRMNPVSQHYTDPILSRESNTSDDEYKNIIAALEYFGDFAGFLDTCLIEYSVIGATVMFVFWAHLDSPIKSSERKQSFRLDFANTFTGFYFGVVIFILGAIVCGVYSDLVNDKNPGAFIILGVYESVCYFSCIFAVILGIYYMRSHVFSTSNHEDVDQILLYIAFVGELLHCSADLSRFINRAAAPQSPFIFAVTLVRLIHVFLQTWFILMASKLELASCTNVSALRGRQCVTFLLVTNLTFFFYNIYTSMTDGFGYTSPLTSDHAYIKLISEPLISFYRFHSTVCLAEVWKKSFSRPKAKHGGSNEEINTVSVA